MNIEKYKAMIESVTEEPNNMSSDWSDFMKVFANLLHEQKQAERDRDINQIAIYKYGGERQKKKLFEEMAELTVAICHTDDGKDSFDHIAEEICDLQIMLEQMILLYGIHGEVNRQRRIKIERLNERIKEAKNGERVS